MVNNLFFGVSPSSEKNFFEINPLNGAVRSIRNSKHGYSNENDVQVSYSSLQNYISDLSSLVNKGVLLEEKNFMPLSVYKYLKFQI